MQIDWLTVSAQIVNFLILVGLLKRFLFRPVINAMAGREQRIAARLNEAEQREAEAAGRAREYEDKSLALERARKDRLDEAREAAEGEKRRLLDEARRDIDEQRGKWHDDLHREQQDLSKAFKRQLAQSAVDIARRTLADMADAGLERQIAATFLRRVEELPEEERAPFARGGTLRVASSFELDGPTRAALARALGASADVEYVQDPELVCGIACTGGDHKLEWNVASYLDDLDDRLDTLFAAHAADGKEPA